MIRLQKNCECIVRARIMLNEVWKLEFFLSVTWGIAKYLRLAWPPGKQWISCSLKCLGDTRLTLSLRAKHYMLSIQLPLTLLSTWLITMFSGFRSLWMMRWPWRNSTAAAKQWWIKVHKGCFTILLNTSKYISYFRATTSSDF